MKASETSRRRARRAATRNVQRFRGGLVFKAHRLLCHSTLGLRVIKKKIPASANPFGVCCLCLFISMHVCSCSFLCFTNSCGSAEEKSETSRWRARRAATANIAPQRWSCSVVKWSNGLRVGRLNGLGGVPREQKILKGHLPRVMYYRVYMCIRRR